jgi:phosphoribosylanthranilate isomerase
VLVEINMTSLIVQIYETQTPADAEKLIEIGVDSIGSVVLSQASWRSLQIRETIKVSAPTKSQSSLILLFNDPDTVFRALDYYQPDIVHFCESLTQSNGHRRNCTSMVALQKNIKVKFPEIKIMRTIPIPQAGLAEHVPFIELARFFEPISDYFLTDTLLVNPTHCNTDRQPVSGFIGITGQTCDWDAAKSLVEVSSKPVILAGGISPDNVSYGIQRVKPAGIDSCTGTNMVDATGHPIRFKKDFSKVKRLVSKVRQAERTLNRQRGVSKIS